MLLEPSARRSKFYYYFGKIIFDFPKKVLFFLGKILFSPVSVPLSKCSTVGQGRSGGSIAPWSSVARYSVVFEHVSSEFPPEVFHGSVELLFSRFRFSACTACVHHSFECTFSPTVARSISPASVALSFYVSVLLNVLHASITFLSALLAPLSLGRFFSSIRKRVFWERWFCVHCRSVGLSWICCCCWWWWWCWWCWCWCCWCWCCCCCCCCCCC